MALFREYDLRGIVGEELTEAIAEQVGAPMPPFARAGHVMHQSWKDGWLSSPALQQALIKGLLCRWVGCDRLGAVRLPLLYFSCLPYRCRAGS